MNELKNIFQELPASLSNEAFQTIMEKPGVRMERIISQGQTTPEGKWYDQEWDEWVLLLSGAAELLFHEAPTPLHLKPGDYIMIPAHRRHRVTWTDPNACTVWLAVHFHATVGKS
jgi:cupin 2 domain-containing protein